MSGPVTYGTSFPLWRAAAGSAWDAYTDHRFVRGLGAGDLPRDAFLRYLRQDYLFLIQFSRAWALAVTKAETLADMRHCSATVEALLNFEMDLHVRICGEAGISVQALEAEPEADATIAYTRYVLDAGHAGDLLDLLAALTPCVWGYGTIGARLAQEAAPDTPYCDWIETYAGDEFQTVCAEVGALTDRVVVARLGPDPAANPRWDGLCARFRTACRLEAGFWQAGLNGA